MNDAKGIYVTKENKYYGFISLNNLLSLSYKRNLEIAQNQNPLTKLPGNKQIEVFLHTVFSENLYSNIVYFDFNDFKPFNDKYGFRQGDRAILIFSELLQKTISSENFIAHIGGDDFFIGFLDKTYEEVYEIVKVLMKTFEINVSSLYSKEDVNRKYIIAKDRFGVERSFNLLSVCAAIVEINEKASEEKFNEMLGKIKKQSKLYSLPYGISIGVQLFCNLSFIEFILNFINKGKTCILLSQKIKQLN
jgi:diguanylate cyclase (GGDEF)-like protein